MTTVVVIVVIRKKKWLDPPLYDYEEEGRQLLFIKFYFGKYFTHLNFASPSEILIILVLWLKLSFNGVSCETMWRLQKHQIHTCDKVDIVVGWGAIVGISGNHGVGGLGGLEGIRGCGRAPGNAMVTTSIIAELEKASTFTQDINYQDIDFHSPSALHSPQKSPHVSLLSPQLQTLFSSKLYFFPNFFFPIYCLSSSNSADPSSWLVVQL